MSIPNNALSFSYFAEYLKIHVSDFSETSSLCKYACFRIQQWRFDQKDGEGINRTSKKIIIIRINLWNKMHEMIYCYTNQISGCCTMCVFISEKTTKILNFLNFKILHRFLFIPCRISKKINASFRKFDKIQQN